MIEVRNLSKSFSDKLVIDNISTSFEKGKTNLIIGQSGSGKTVFLKCIVGLLKFEKGDVLFNDIVFNTLDFEKKQEMRRQMGMLFQSSALFDYLTVEENVMFPLDMFSSKSKAEKIDRVNFCLQRVNISNSNNLLPSEISGGMQKRVAIARAIALNPKYLFCDEPNSGLDPKTAIVIDNLIKEITHEFNTTTIINTHDMNSVLGMGDKIVFIHQGRKEWEGSSNDVMHSSNQYLNEFVFASKMAKKLKESMNQ
jgi:phospholipid/cholesterol/gamma-HCH transport system ATP-binding protein